MWHVVGGQTVRRDDLVIATRRFCPACLAEAAYHRAWFDLTFMVTCPLHGVELTDIGEGGARVGWSTASTDITSNGFRLSRPAPRRPDGEAGFEGYALGRFGLSEPRPSGLLDGHRLGEVAEAVRWVGLLSLGGRRSRMSDVLTGGVSPRSITEAGYSVLARGLEGATTLFQEVADDAPADTHGATRLFGWAYKTFTEGLPLALVLRDLMTDVAHRMGRAGTRSSRSRPTSVIGPTINQVARDSGFRAKDVLKVATRLECLAPRPYGPKTPHVVPARDVSVVLGGFRWSMTRAQAAARLAVAPETFQMLLRHGYVERFTAGHGGDRKDVFHFGDLLGFLEAIPTIRLDPGQVGSPSLVALVPLGKALATMGEAGMRLLDDVLCGDSYAFQTAPFVDDLDDVLIEAPSGRASKPSSRSSRAPSAAATKREAATLLDVSTATIKLLLEQGHLANLGGSQKRNMLDRGSVKAFGARFLAGRYYAGALGVDASHVGERLAKLGIEDLLCDVRPRAGDRKNIGALYDRQAMRSALGMAEDPDATTPGRQAWKRFATHLGRGRQGLMVWTIKGERSATCADGTKEFVAKVAISDAEDGVLFTAEVTARDTEDKQVVAALAARLASTDVPANLTYVVPPEGGLLQARVTATLASWPEHPGAVEPRRERADFDRMGKALLVLRGALDVAGHAGSQTEDDTKESEPPLRLAG